MSAVGNDGDVGGSGAVRLVGGRHDDERREDEGKCLLDANELTRRDASTFPWDASSLVRRVRTSPDNHHTLIQ